MRYLAKFQMANAPPTDGDQQTTPTTIDEDEQLVNKVKVGPACDVGDSGDEDGPTVPFTERSLN